MGTEANLQACEGRKRWRISAAVDEMTIACVSKWRFDAKKIPLCAGGVLLIVGICLVIGNLDELLDGDPDAHTCKVVSLLSTHDRAVDRCTFKWTVEVNDRGRGIIEGSAVMDHHRCATGQRQPGSTHECWRVKRRSRGERR